MTNWRLTPAEAEEPVFLGGEVSEGAQELLEDNGVVTTRRPDGARVAITADPTRLPESVRWVHCPYMGVDSLAGRLPGSVSVLTRTVDGMPQRLASYSTTAVATERWGWHKLMRDQAAHVWRQRHMHTEPDGRAALVLGVGVVGQAVGLALRAQFPRIEGASLSGRAVEGFDRVYALRDDAAIAWPGFDTLVVTLPLTAQTHGIVDAPIISRLDRAHLIVVGRGATLDLEALAWGLETGAVRHATLDVLAQEPPAPDSWLWDHPQVTLTPHVAGLTEAMDVVASFTKARQCLVEGRDPAGLVRPGSSY